MCLVCAVGALAASCGGGSGESGTSPADTPVGTFLRGTAAEPTTIDPETLRAPPYCPPVRILPDTETLRREDGEGDDAVLRWQATIGRTARECSRAAEGVSVRVGVSGRVVEGPRGAPDVVELPLRIAVREGDEVTYSRLHNVRVSVDAASQGWAFVDDAVVVAAPRSADIVVGFDG